MLVEKCCKSTTWFLKVKLYMFLPVRIINAFANIVDSAYLATFKPFLTFTEPK